MRFEPMTSAMPRKSIYWACVSVKGVFQVHVWDNCMPSMCEDHFFNLFISSQLSGFIAQLVRALHQLCRSHGFEFHWRHLNNFQVHIWDNCWDCPASVRIISSIHLSTTIQHFCNFKLLLLFLGENKAIEWYLINFSVRKGVSSVWQPDQTKTSTKAKDMRSKVTESTMQAFLDWRES